MIYYPTKSELKRLSNIFERVGSISLSAILLPAILNNNIISVSSLVGGLSTLVLWLAALRLERGVSYIDN